MCLHVPATVASSVALQHYPLELVMKHSPMCCEVERCALYAMRSGSFARIRAGRLWEWINWRREGEGGGMWLGREGRRRQKRGKGRKEAGRNGSAAYV